MLAWCGKPFEPRRTGGSVRRFCSARHRTAFHTAARRWAECQVAAGRLSVAVLRAGARTACTPRLAAEDAASDGPRRLTPIRAPAARGGDFRKA